MGLGIYQTIEVVNRTDTVILCHTLSYILPGIFNCVVSLMFIGVGLKIQSLVNQYEQYKLRTVDDESIKN